MLIHVRWACRNFVKSAGDFVRTFDSKHILYILPKTYGDKLVILARSAFQYDSDRQSRTVRQQGPPDPARQTGNVIINVFKIFFWNFLSSTKSFSKYDPDSIIPLDKRAHSWKNNMCEISAICCPYRPKACNGWVMCPVWRHLASLSSTYDVNSLPTRLGSG